MNPLVEFLGLAVRARGASPFLTDLRLDATYSYETLAARAGEMCALLRSRGVLPGDRVAYLTRNNPFFFPLLFACARAGASLVPVCRDAHSDEVRSILEAAGARLAVVDGPPGEIPAEAFGGRPLLWVDPATGIRGPLPAGRAAVAGPPAADRGEDDEALLVFTSGTTGAGKGIRLTHKNLTANAAAVASFYGYEPGQRFLSVLPYYHINAPMITGLACLAGGAHVVVEDVFDVRVAKTYWKTVRERNVNVLSLTPSLMAVLLRLFPDGAPEDLSGVSHALVGTARLEETLWRRFEKTFGVPCYQGYGLTETTTWVAVTPRDGRKRYDTAGVPLDCEIKIGPRGDLEDAPAPPKGAGEVLVRGAAVMAGYTSSEFTREVFIDGWLRTGDLGYLDSDGQLVIVGRLKNVIKRRGGLIFPEEIEACLRQHEGVLECCAIGVPHPVDGERVVAVCVPKGAAPAALDEFARARLSSHKWPDDIVIAHRLPKNVMGKVRPGAVRALVTGETARTVVRLLNARDVRRAPPSDLPGLRAVAQAALLSGRPFTVTGYWGAGGRTSVGEAETLALDRLQRVVRSVDDIAGAPTVAIRLLLADVHARNNGVDDHAARLYFADVQAEAAKRGLDGEFLGDVWKRRGLEVDAALRRAEEPGFVREWERFPLREEFVRRASRRGVPGRASPDQAARRYYALLKTERAALTEHCRGGAFFSYAGPEMRALLPDVPVLYWFSVKHGVSERPWFIERPTP